jgi:predicted NAD/FAD-dependent oxidoreductase
MAALAIVGAGIAGLACARDLAGSGASVTVFEKARGPGGRLCTRRRHDDLRFDHGAQFFTARGADFVERVRRWQSAGVVKPWRGLVGRFDGEWGTEPDSISRWVGAPRMSALSRHLARGLDVRLETRVTALGEAGDGRWRLATSTQSVEEFDAVLMTCPGPQAAALLPAGPVQDRAKRLRYDPCVALMGIVSTTSVSRWPYSAGSLHDDVIQWLAREDEKPGRDGPARMVVHATPKWSDRHFDDDPTQIQGAIVERTRALTGVELVDVTLHRWRYARARPDPHQPAHILDTASGLGLAGDGLAGARVEAAHESGAALSRAVAAWLRSRSG